MRTHKVSVSLQQTNFDFVEQYKKAHLCKSRSEVFNRALSLLRQNELESSYRDANSEIINDFETTLTDGLDENEAW